MIYSAFTFLTCLSWHITSPKVIVPQGQLYVNTQNRPLCYEIGHYIAQWNAEDFQAISDFLFAHYGEDVPIYDLLETQKAKLRESYKRDGKAIPSEAQLEKLAHEELVCDMLSRMLADKNAYDKLIELKQKDLNLFQKLGKAIKKLLDKLAKSIGIYDKYTPDFKYAASVETFGEEAFRQLQDLYIKAFVQADANFKSAQGKDMTGHSKGDESIPLRHERTDHDAKKNQNIVDKTTNDDKNSITNTTSRGDSHDNGGVRKGIKENSGHVQYDGRGYPENVGDAQATQEWGNQTSTVQRVVKRAVKAYINQSANSLEILDLLYYLAGKSERDMTPQIYSIAVEGLTKELFADATTMSLSFFREKWILLGRDVDSLYHDIRSAVTSADNNSDSAVTAISSQEYQQLVSHFSTTENYDVAGYLLKDGQMLDFSGKHWGYTNSKFRKVDHRDIVEAWGNEDGDGTNEMTRMIANGNVRLMPESRGINLAVMPNKSQLMVLRGYIDHFGGKVIVDVDRIGDDTIHSFSYHKGTSSSRIIADLRAYFENGTIPKPQSNIGGFLYSDRTEDSVSNRSLLANAFEDLAQNDIERSKLQEYKDNVTMLNAEEQILTDLNNQIKNLSFSKGPRDKEKLKSLREKAAKTANRINTYDSILLRLEASKPLQGVLVRERKKAYDRAVQRGKEKLSDYRENSAKKQVKHKIQRVVKELDDLLLNDDKKRHVPDSLKKAVAGALKILNRDTTNTEERIAKYEKLIAEETDPDKIDAYQETLENIVSAGEKMGEKLGQLHSAYKAILTSDDPDIQHGYDASIADAIAEMSETIGSTPISKMSMEQLEDVYNVYKTVLTRVRDARDKGAVLLSPAQR